MHKLLHSVPEDFDLGPVFDFDDDGDRGRYLDTDTDTIAFTYSPAELFLNDLFSQGHAHAAYLGRIMDNEILTLEDLCTFIKNGHCRFDATPMRELITLIIERDPRMFDAGIGKEIIKCLRKSFDQLMGFSPSSAEGVDIEGFMEEIIKQSGYVPKGKILFGFSVAFFEKYLDRSISASEMVKTLLSPKIYDVDREICQRLCEILIEEGIPSEDELDAFSLALFLSKILNSVINSDEAWVLKLIESIANNRPDHVDIFCQLVQKADWGFFEISFKTFIEHICSFGVTFDFPHSDYIQSAIIALGNSPSDMIDMSDRFKAYMPFIQRCISEEYFDRAETRRTFFFSISCDESQHMDCPVIATDDIKALMSPLNSGIDRVSFDSESQLLQKFLDLMESNQELSEYIRANPISPTFSAKSRDKSLY